MRKSKMEKLLQARRKTQEPQQMTMEELFLLLLDGDRLKEERTALPTQRMFNMDPSRIKGFMGPVGSAKTSTLCSGAYLRALLTPGSKGLVARANYNDLMDTTGLRMQEMLNRLPKDILLDRDKSPPMKWYLQAVPTLDEEGGILCDDPSSITFMGLQDGLGSYEFDWAIVDEMAEVEEQRVHEINTRLRNRPKSWPAGAEGYSLAGAFNPPDTMHWIYTATTGRDHTGRKVKEPWMKLFQSAPRENERNLPPGYYERLAQTLPEDMRVRLVEGQWGSTFEGAPVYREFKYGTHAKDELIAKYDRYQPLYRFWDFGYRHPFCVVVQPDERDRLLHLVEIVRFNLEIDPFVTAVKQTCERHFPGHTEWYDYGDPAARQKKDTGSTLAALQRSKIHLRWRIATIDDGLRVCRLELERLIDGEPAIQFDRQLCPTLINALRGGYHLDDSGQKPVKDGLYDHSADAWRYGIYNLCAGSMSKSATANLPKSLAYNPKADQYR